MEARSLSPHLNALHLAEKSLAGEELTREEALSVLAWPDEKILSLMQATYKVRHAAFGKKVRLNYLVNIQSGMAAPQAAVVDVTNTREKGVGSVRWVRRPS